MRSQIVTAAGRRGCVSGDRITRVLCPDDVLCSLTAEGDAAAYCPVEVAQTLCRSCSSCRNY